MKKIRLSVPTPCHENWKEMTPEDKGRFCSSCQKTVADFTAMSDRQLADFFKKPAGSVCGRFHNDQLDRAIEIPRKRIPWVKYFFTVTWPAFVLVLKGCGLRNDVQGEIMVKEKNDGKMPEVPYATVGMVMPDIRPVDSFPPKKHMPADVPVDQVAPLHSKASPAIMGDTSIAEIGIDTLIAEAKTPLDTVNISSYSSDCSKNAVMGGLTVVRVDVVKDKIIPLTETPKQSIETVAYPNPIKAGGQLTVSLPTNDETIKQIQLFSSSGALIRLPQIDPLKGKKITLTLPPGLLAGTYFLRLMPKRGRPSTVKIIVLN